MDSCSPIDDGIDDRASSCESQNHRLGDRVHRRRTASHVANSKWSICPISASTARRCSSPYPYEVGAHQVATSQPSRRTAMQQIKRTSAPWGGVIASSGIGPYEARRLSNWHTLLGCTAGASFGDCNRTPAVPRRAETAEKTRTRRNTATR
jgi:hypothetical protein